MEKTEQEKQQRHKDVIKIAQALYDNGALTGPDLQIHTKLSKERVAELGQSLIDIGRCRTFNLSDGFKGIEFTEDGRKRFEAYLEKQNETKDTPTAGPSESGV